MSPYQPDTLNYSDYPVTVTKVNIFRATQTLRIMTLFLLRLGQYLQFPWHVHKEFHENRTVRICRWITGQPDTASLITRFPGKEFFLMASGLWTNSATSVSGINQQVSRKRFRYSKHDALRITSALCLSLPHPEGCTLSTVNMLHVPRDLIGIVMTY